MELISGDYIIGYSDGKEESNNRLYKWLMNENREPAQTFFAAGSERNLAKEMEYRINEAAKRS